MNSLLRRLRGDQRGVVMMIAGFSIVAFVGFTAMVVDVGYLIYAKRLLQASTDAAALAGAQDINKGAGGTAVSTANSYSATSGNLNAAANLTVTMASGYPALRCFTSTGVSCGAPDNANGIVVKQNATVPLFFGKVLGLNTVTISASAAAGRAGGAAQPVDAIIILDTTASMNTADTTCALSGATRLSCAFAGFRTLLQGFDPSQARVALMIFPGLTTTTAAAQEYDCSSTTPSSSTIAQYDASANPPTTTPPVYLIVPFSTDYKSGSSLNTSSNLVKAARGGASGCTAGVTAYGGVGTFFTDVITAAKNYMNANARTGVTKMIIFLGDGDAGASASNVPSGRTTNQCHTAITAAQSATAAGMTVVTIAYGAPTSSTSSCSTDSPRISACSTLQQMASSLDNFYSDNASSGTSCNSSANPISDLNQIFQSIGTSVGTGARLLPDNTT